MIIDKSGITFKSVYILLYMFVAGHWQAEIRTGF
jgi:hypothetical protein